MKKCDGCKASAAERIEFTMAFQPILDLEARAVWGYEALVRGPNDEPARTILDKVDDDNRYWFDQTCRTKAISLAARHLPANAKLSINFLPKAVYEPRACIRATLAAARQACFDPSRLMFEFTEDERMDDPQHTAHIVDAYRAMGFTTALDDFGSGHAGLSLLAQFQPDIIKIDRELVRAIDQSAARRAILKGVVVAARELGITLLAEGVETEEELRTLRAAHIRLFQGFLLGRPKTGKVENIVVPKRRPPIKRPASMVS